MSIDQQFSMLLRIADFFRYMSENDEERFYYVVPIEWAQPYAYQHSSIRDIGTLCDVLELVRFLRENNLKIIADFDGVIEKTLGDYYSQFQKGRLRSFNIGDIGFFLLALKNCESTFLNLLPKDWKETKDKLVQKIIERQKPNGSISIYYDDELNDGHLSAEAFYLPEALIGLMAVSDGVVVEAVKRGVAYMSQDSNRSYHLAADYATFYYNWQFQLLYHWIKHTKEASPHLEKLMQAIKHARIARTPFDSHAATVEVACYLEGLVYGREALKMLESPLGQDPWIEKEVERCLAFLYQLQNETFSTFYGGFSHSRFSDEARIDVAGHVLGGLLLLLKAD